LVFFILFIGYSSVFAHDTTCIDNATTNKGVDQCGDFIVPLKEKKIEEEFNRLFEKYKDNDDMKALIKLTKRSWENYRNMLCNFVGAAAAGGLISEHRGLPIEANKEYLKCVIHTLDEMELVLNKF